MGILKGFFLAIKALFCGQATLIAENLGLRQQCSFRLCGPSLSAST